MRLFLWAEIISEGEAKSEWKVKFGFVVGLGITLSRNRLSISPKMHPRGGGDIRLQG